MFKDFVLHVIDEEGEESNVRLNSLSVLRAATERAETFEDISFLYSEILVQFVEEISKDRELLNVYIDEKS